MLPVLHDPASDRARRRVDGSLVALFAVLKISLAVDLWWLHHFRAGYPLDIDESRYLELGLRLSDGLTNGGPSAFWHVWSAQRDFGSLLPLISMPVYIVLGRTLLGGLATQLVFFGLLVVSSYGIGTRLRSRTADRSCAPHVTQTSPAGGGAAAPTTAAVTAVFSLPMETPSLRTAFVLTDTRSGRRVAGTVSFFGEIALIFRSQRPLARRTRFTATISSAARAATGFALRPAKQWSFRTGG